MFIFLDSRLCGNDIRAMQQRWLDYGMTPRVLFYLLPNEETILLINDSILIADWVYFISSLGAKS